MEKIYKQGYSLSKVDSSGKQPVDYARLQKSGVLLNCISRLLQDPELATGVDRRASGLPQDEWPELKVDFEADQKLFLEEAEEKEGKEIKEKKQ